MHELQRTAGNTALRRLAAEPLDADVRLSMEKRFGTDLGDVRVHADQDADARATRVGAAAFTEGSSIVFSAGMYRPESELGRIVIAHELAHIVQQTRRAEPPSLDAPQLEAEADAAAVFGEPVGASAAPGALQALPGPQSASAPPARAAADREQTAAWRRSLILEADRQIAKIDEALTNGYIWWFERKAFSGRTEAETTAIAARSQVLRELARRCSEFIDSLERGVPPIRWWQDDFWIQFSAFVERQSGGRGWLERELPWGHTAQSYRFFDPDREKPVVPPEPPTGVKRAEPPPPAAAQPAPEPPQQTAVAPQPAAAPPASAATPESNSEATDWTIEVPEPDAEPTVVRELLPGQASYAHAYPRTTKLFRLWRERGGGRYYYRGLRGIVYLPDLRQQFPALASDAPPEASMVKPEEAGGPDPRVRRRVNRPRF